MGQTSFSFRHCIFILLTHCNYCVDNILTLTQARWVKLLSREYPTLAFHASITNSFGKGSLISLLRQFSALHSSRKQISVGFIGYPNTGKSSIINTLRKKKVCTVAPIPGETKVWQYITLMKRIYLIDCPGCVPPSMTDTPEDILLRGVVRTENVEHPAQYIPAVLKRCQTRHLERTYDIKGWEEKPTSTLEEEAEKSDKTRVEESIRFLELIARKSGRLIKGGEADIDGIAKLVINDFLRGKLPWYIPPPKAEGKEKEDEETQGRDEKLGLTGKKRKAEDEADEESAEVDDAESDDEEFAGFDEGEGGVSLVAGESDEEDEPEAKA